MSPLVSISIPTFNGAAWIMDCLQSALAQTYRPIEVLVLDDRSADETVELVRSLKDARIRLSVNDRNQGLANNWNRCIALARGEYLKFLFQDDILYPDCVGTMARLLMSHERLGFVFSPRDVLLECDVENTATLVWLKNCRTLHARFTGLGEINNGRSLLDQYVSGGLQGNWIGEPSSVMIRTRA